MENREKAVTTKLSHVLMVGLGLSVSASVEADHEQVDIERTLAAVYHTNKQEAQSLLTRLAENGDTKAQLVLARMYHTGLGANKDMEQALRWYRLAAEQGLAEAQFQLSLIYLESKYEIADEEVVLELLLNAAVKGHQQAQFFYDSLTGTDDFSGC